MKIKEVTENSDVRYHNLNCPFSINMAHRKNKKYWKNRKVKGEATTDTICPSFCNCEECRKLNSKEFFNLNKYNCKSV